MAPADRQQEEQSVEITQVPALSPPCDTNIPAKAILVKDVSDSTPQNINPLTIEDLNKILDQSTQQARLCENVVLVSVEEYQKIVAHTTRDKVNPQEPPLASLQLLVPNL